MYVRTLSLHNIRCFPDLLLRFPAPQADGNWCVILGDNGTGKSTVLQALTLALLSPQAASRLVESPEGWVRAQAPYGECSAVFQPAGDAGGELVSNYLVARGPVTVGSLKIEEPAVVHRAQHLTEEGRRAIFGLDRPGYLLAAYGPFRRLELSDERKRQVRREDMVRSLFDPESGLSDLEAWLQWLDYMAKDRDALGHTERNAYRERLEGIREVINGLLPRDGSFRLQHVNARGVYFVADGGKRIPLAEMSDGYRTMFGLAVDLLRWAHRARGLGGQLFRRAEDGRLTVDVEGMVLIDEVDAHLHPRWQQEIGVYLKRAFPRVQFIVATHSPFVAQAAGPGALLVLRREGTEGVRLESLPAVQGWPAERILQSPAFGLESTRGPEADALLVEHARLMAKQERVQLIPAEQERLGVLAAQLAEVLPAAGGASETLEELAAMLRAAREQE